MRRLLVAALCCLLLAPVLSAGELYIASWNVENLFDTIDDPKVEGDEEFTPAGPKKYTPARYQAHLASLAKVLMKMNDGKGPDVLGLAEIENRTVLEDLIKHLAPLQRDYRIVHQDSPSHRGIDVAIFYDAKRLTLAKEEFLTVPAGKTRDIAHADLTVDGKHLHVFMNHWPARANPEEHRIIAAKTLRKRLDALLAEDAGTDAIVLGDFNDYPTDVSLTTHLKAADSPANLPPGAFYNTMWPIHKEKKGTYVFKNKWEVIDHVIISPGLLDNKNFQWKAGSTQVVQYPFQLFTPLRSDQITRPNRLYSGNFYHKDGVSDHLPVACVLQY